MIYTTHSVTYIIYVSSHTHVSNDCNKILKNLKMYTLNFDFWRKTPPLNRRHVLRPNPRTVAPPGRRQ